MHEDTNISECISTHNAPYVLFLVNPYTSRDIKKCSNMWLPSLSPPRRRCHLLRNIAKIGHICIPVTCLKCFAVCTSAPTAWMTSGSRGRYRNCHHLTKHEDADWTQEGDLYIGNTACICLFALQIGSSNPPTPAEQDMLRTNEWN